jgi:hypothetical protein
MHFWHHTRDDNLVKSDAKKYQHYGTNQTGPKSGPFMAKDAYYPHPPSPLHEY